MSCGVSRLALFLLISVSDDGLGDTVILTGVGCFGSQTWL